MSDKLAPAGKHKYIHDGNTIYEWDQTLSEVNIYIEVPTGVKAKQLFVNISSSHISLGIRPNPPYLDRDLSERVKAGESYWTLEDGILHLQLCKAEKGQPWKSAIAGHEIDPVQAESEKQRLLLERFQEEHPGFDFSGATFNGEAPNPRTFMGGMSSA
ncbi:g1269 [Coccomyxa elongata]